jgi:hypothetical protein
MIKRNINAEIELTPNELAFEFCEMNADEQADFFNLIALLSASWDAPFCFQSQSITDSKKLTTEGRAIMASIGEYSEPASK